MGNMANSKLILFASHTECPTGSELMDRIEETFRDTTVF